MNDNPRANGPRGRDPYAALRLIALIAAIAGVIVLAAAAFVLSYGGIHKIALSAGVSPSVARIFPVIFDAMLVVSCAAVVSLRAAGWWQRTYSWLSTLTLLVVVAAADAAHATGTHIPRKPAAAIVAVLPWALLLLAFSLLLSMLRQFRRTRAAEAAGAGAPVIGGAAAGTAPVGMTTVGPAPVATVLAGAAYAATVPNGSARPETAAAGTSTRAGLDILDPRSPAPQPAVAGTATQPSAVHPARTVVDSVPARERALDARTATPARPAPTPEPPAGPGEAAADTTPTESALNGAAPAGSADHEPAGQERADQEPAGEEQAAQEQAPGCVQAVPAPEPKAQPAQAQPADAQPADAQPADAQPADAQPADAQPADAQSPDAQSYTERPDTGPSGTGQPGTEEQPHSQAPSTEEPGAEPAGDQPAEPAGGGTIRVPHQAMPAPVPAPSPHFDRLRSTPTPPEDEPDSDS